MMTALESYPPDDLLWMNGDNILLEDLLMRTMIAVKEGKVPSYFMPDEAEEMDVDADGVCDKIKEMLEDIDKFLDELPTDDIADFMQGVAKLFNDLCDRKWNNAYFLLSSFYSTIISFAISTGISLISIKMIDSMIEKACLL